MYDMSTRERALALVAQGRSLNSVSKETGVSRAAIRAWQTRIEPLPRMQGHVPPCVRCAPAPGLPTDEAAYSYLLGLYLGDGCISPGMRSGFYLRIACADAYPGLIDACAAALTAINPVKKSYRVQAVGYVSVVGYSRHWPCLFPQHGPGKKHNRKIALEPWQQEIVDAYPWEFIRGLIHSDGCRITNWTTRVIGGERKRYKYPRYFFTNKSEDVRRLYTDTLDKLGVAWKQANQHNISVARKEAVALMDLHVGPKH
ncbi:helix-turn-helix domain-containing protein [Streptomyces sp. SID8379]|uniref:helix-turn-helix domain-containing protein n=1 Tax=unclassified Streptomyces TaxID=2593676 RepID=UPI00047727C7|nr:MULTISPECIES: helix-turn-helix domain-containing protein [unclassified Streptomyces]MYW66380.1 helix-turn-helix domain-containing protein [Streptomyces sp. SID8379]